MTLPGSTAFIRQQSATLASDRDCMVDQLTSYLTSAKHDAEHVRQILHMALESIADATHRSAMQSATQPATWNEPLPMPLPPSAEARPVQSLQLTAEIERLQQEQTSTQQVIQLIQQDLQKIAEDLSQLHVETRMNTQRPLPRDISSTRQSWPVPVTPPATYARPSRLQLNPPRTSESVEQLRNRIRMLETQLQQAQSSTRPGGVQQAMLVTPYYPGTVGRLMPRQTANGPLSPLEPVNELNMFTCKYYVGDVMEPPFAGATLKLMQFIKANVAPESWKDSDMIQISDPSISLVIRQTRANHLQIAGLLEHIRAGSLTYSSGQRR